MQEPEKSWNEEQKNEVHYERNEFVRFESITKQNPRKIKRGKSYQVFMENIDIYLDTNEVRLEIKNCFKILKIIYFKESLMFLMLIVILEVIFIFSS